MFRISERVWDCLICRLGLCRARGGWECLWLSGRRRLDRALGARAFLAGGRCDGGTGARALFAGGRCGCGRWFLVAAWLGRVVRVQVGQDSGAMVSYQRAGLGLPDRLVVFSTCLMQLGVSLAEWPNRRRPLSQKHSQPPRARHKPNLQIKQSQTRSLIRNHGTTEPLSRPAGTGTSSTTPLH